jgi:hypothetical protein
MALKLRQRGLDQSRAGSITARLARPQLEGL